MKFNSLTFMSFIIEPRNKTHRCSLVKINFFYSGVRNGGGLIYN